MAKKKGKMEEYQTEESHHEKTEEILKDLSPVNDLIPDFPEVEKKSQPDLNEIPAKYRKFV